jgi:glycosyltransferase involved in cell wall biosynthesis
MTAPLTTLIAAAGQPALLARTLDSLARCEQPPSYAETVVVENGPPCGIEAVAQSAPAALRVRYLYVPAANKSHALNVALTTVPEGLIFFTDDDVRFDPQILLAYSRVSKGVTSGEFYGGPLVAEYEGPPPPSWINRFLPKTAKGWQMCVREKTRLTDRTFLGPNWAAFACDLRAIGGFEPRIGPGAPTGSTGQETEAQHRLFAAGAKAYYVPDAWAWHFVRSKCINPKWIVERGYRHGLEWGIRRGRDPKFFGFRERMTWLRLVRRRAICRLLRAVGGKRWRLAADYAESRWKGRWDGIAIGRDWDHIAVPELPEELRRAA